VRTYRNRTEEVRYSRQVSNTEIEENDFNLNISRYITTAKPEEIIDLKEENEKIAELDKTIKKSQDAHNVFLKALGKALI